MAKYYLKYIINHNNIHELLSKNNCKNIIFYIDIMSIARGFYNKNTLLFEIDYYVTNNQQISNFFINELRDFLNNLYKSFRYYNPKFIIFFDNGKCKQNSDLCSYYKSGRNSLNDFISENEEIELLKLIKKYYFEKMENEFQKSKLSTVINLQEYEADFIPYFVLYKNLLNSQNQDTLNVILSLDKDLLQTCEYTNVIQIVTTYKNKELSFKLYCNENAIEYFYKSFKRGFLSAKHIPLMLAIAGDKADGIEGVKGIGFAKAHDLIVKFNIDADINESTILPKELEPYKKIIYNNWKLISFKSQISRINPIITSLIENKIKEL